MSNPLIAAVVQVLEGVDGLQEVHDNGLALPTTSPCAAVEWAAEGEADPAEFGGGPLDLDVTLSVSVLAKVRRDSEAAAARDQVAGLARAARKALLADPTLGGACQGSRLAHTEFGYLKIGGESWCVGTIPITALIED